MLSTKELYNNAYKMFTPEFVQKENLPQIEQYLQENRDGLQKFFDSYTHQFQITDFTQMSALELGCGLGSLSLYLAPKFRKYCAVDYSELAIMNAKQICALKGMDIDYQIFDVLTEQSLAQKFDLIIDSHLWHCLTNDAQRVKYLSFIKRHLSPKGTFLLETMVFQKQLKIPVGYFYNQDGVLGKEIGSQIVPIRAIRKSIEIENDIKSAGLAINYLYYHNELSFMSFDDYQDYPGDWSPKTLRLSATLK